MNLEIESNSGPQHSRERDGVVWVLSASCYIFTKFLVGKVSMKTIRMIPEGRTFSVIKQPHNLWVRNNQSCVQIVGLPELTQLTHLVLC